MKPTMSLAQLANHLDEITGELTRRQDENFRAWSQTVLKPGCSEGWDRLTSDLCQICELVEAYYEHIDAFWGTEGAPRVRPVVLRDPTLVEVVRDMVSFRDASQHRDPCRVQATQVQRGVWKLLNEFPEAHGRFLVQLRNLVENPSNS